MITLPIKLTAKAPENGWLVQIDFLTEAPAAPVPKPAAPAPAVPVFNWGVWTPAQTR